MIWLMATAFAQSLDRYPRMAPVPLADGEGVWRVPVPPTLRSPEDPEDGTDLMLVDAAGEPVSVAWARGTGDAVSVQSRIVLTPAADTIDLQLDGPADWLELQLSASPSAATAQAFERVDGDWVPLSEPTLLWQHPQGEQRTLALERTTEGMVRLELTHHHRRSALHVEAWRDPAPSVSPVTLTLPVIDRQLGEDGWARYLVPLPSPLPIERVGLTVEEGLFDRRIALIRGGSLNELGTVRRMRIGGASVEHVDVPTGGVLYSDRLEIAVDAHGDAPLTITAVTVTLEGVDMMVVDPAGGPFFLYGGAPPQDATPSDLTFAVPDLYRAAAGVVETGAVTANPAYQPPEVRAGLAGPSTPIALSDFTTVRAVSGEGLVRIPLDAQVLSEARSALGDLRLIDTEGRQIPYLLERRAVDARWVDLPVEREEDGTVTRLKIALPHPEIPVASITLTTDATLFQRRVTAWRARGSNLEPLRSYEWVGADRPGALTLELAKLVGETLLITIENGDDPPLPVEIGAAGWAQHELIARLPADGARLVYGSSQVAAPSYDLALLGSDLQRRATQEATLGAPEILQPPVSPWDRRALGVGLGVLVAGLIWLTIRLVRTVEAPTAEPSASRPA